MIGWIFKLTCAPIALLVALYFWYVNGFTMGTSIAFGVFLALFIPTWGYSFYFAAKHKSYPR